MTEGFHHTRPKLEANYAALPDAFWAEAMPASFPSPALVVWNEQLAEALGFERSVDADDRARFAAGQSIPAGATPIAQAYAGHQYGHGTMLGDGRAMLLGEHRTPSGALVDVHLKGSGQTRFARRGDGRAALGPMLREYLVSESMHALGIPTTRSLAVATTGEMIPRDGLKPGAVLVRTAASHLRVGTFEYAAALDDRVLLRKLAEFAIARHDADLLDEDDRVAKFLTRVVERQAKLVALWQSIGFVHGVMNTDNTTISGETIDYGPCAFMDAYDAETVFSSIDRFGRYRYSQQPAITHWNLARLAESLVPLLVSGHGEREADEARAIDCANEVLAAFPPAFERAWLAAFRAKLGLASEEAEDPALIRDALEEMQALRLDFTNTFRALSEGRVAATQLSEAWIARWSQRIAREHVTLEPSAGRALVHQRMCRVNPAIIPRNHRVEEALAAAEAGDFAPFHALVGALQRPFQPAQSDARFQEPAPSEFCGYRTFCGT